MTKITKLITAILFIILFLAGALTTIFGALDQYENGSKITKVDCYDKFSNKIDNQICEEKYRSEYISIGIYFFLTSLGVLMLNTLSSMGEGLFEPFTNFFGVKEK